MKIIKRERENNSISESCRTLGEIQHFATGTLQNWKEILQPKQAAQNKINLPWTKCAMHIKLNINQIEAKAQTKQ